MVNENWLALFRLAQRGSLRLWFLIRPMHREMHARGRSHNFSNIFNMIMTLLKLYCFVICWRAKLNEYAPTGIRRGHRGDCPSNGWRQRWEECTSDNKIMLSVRSAARTRRCCTATIVNIYSKRIENKFENCHFVDQRYSMGNLCRCIMRIVPPSPDYHHSTVMKFAKRSFYCGNHSLRSKYEMELNDKQNKTRRVKLIVNKTMRKAKFSNMKFRRKYWI